MRRIAAGSLLLVFAALGGCKSAPAPLTDADRAAARDMTAAMSTAIGASDVPGVTALYAPDAMMMPPSMPMSKGTDQIRQFFQGMTSVKVNLQLTQQTADGSGDFMYTTGRYHYQAMPPAAGTEDGKYLLVFRRGADANWKVVAESWSPDAPPAPPAAPAPTKPAARGRQR
jgi:ketosteroid isomerase-like protein